MKQTDTWIIVFIIGYTKTILVNAVPVIQLLVYQFGPRLAAPTQDTVLTVSSLVSEIK